jgi:hypothetical protein
MDKLEFFFTSHSNQSSHVEDDITYNHEHEEICKKMKIQDCMGQTKFYFGSLPFSPWAILAK